jgi:hypothetical protein
MLGQGKGELDGERFDGGKASVDIIGQNRCIKDKEGNVILPLGRVLINDFDWDIRAVDEADARQVLTAEQSRLQESKDSSGFGSGDTVVDIKMIRQGGSEVGNIDHWVEGTQLSEQEVEHCGLVGNEGMDAEGDESLNRDSRRAMANDDGGVLGSELFDLQTGIVVEADIMWVS